MSTLTVEPDPLATALTLTADRFSVELADGRSLSVPLAWYPRLMQATETERAHWRLIRRVPPVTAPRPPKKG